jgi:hypothetical protein
VESRLPYEKLSTEAAKPMFALGGYIARCGLEKGLIELVKIRASQINGCAYLDCHRFSNAYWARICVEILPIFPNRLIL